MLDRDRPRKRKVDHEHIERAVTGIIRQLESSGETEISSGEIGPQVMEALKSLDDVAFVRFASVYRNFPEIKDFPEARGICGDEAPWRWRRRLQPRGGNAEPLHGGRDPAVAPARRPDLDNPSVGC